MRMTDMLKRGKPEGEVSQSIIMAMPRAALRLTEITDELAAQKTKVSSMKQRVARLGADARKFVGTEALVLWQVAEPPGPGIRLGARQCEFSVFRRLLELESGWRSFESPNFASNQRADVVVAYRRNSRSLQFRGG
jgi:hypothetical protein